MTLRSSSKAGTARLHVLYGSAVVLLASGAAYFLYAGVDTAISLSYRDHQVHELEETRRQLMSALPELVRTRTDAEVIAAFEQAAGEVAREKDGCWWVGMIGLKFAAEGELVHVSPAWNYGSADPCFP